MKWISVDERLPEEAKNVQIHEPHKGWGVGWLTSRGWWCEYPDPGVALPTHWMPLPDPPDEECECCDCGHLISSRGVRPYCELCKHLIDTKNGKPIYIPWNLVWSAWGDDPPDEEERCSKRQ